MRDTATVAGLNIPESTLKLYVWNADKQDWVWCPARVDLANHSVRGRAMRLGHFKAVWRRDGN